ncbi:2-aminoethanethiol dioxygenase [Trichosurus vulpecula]|uniref:2-aminoethanethiol dioxygenase n=1 Tax=Trichosurus vulpecula TaxID=9337 RepID=UPI00186B4B22|nr:2-aminoethanethiol dioxygenase [Trichosurus vulpecula]
MPRDNMTTLIQRIARQARLTFRRGGGGGGAPEAAFPENLQQLQQLLSQLRAEDLNISPRRAALPSPPPARPPHLPPVTYMHICETAEFSLGVFLLKSGTSIPLHDHPGMHGVLKVLYGTLRISCLDPLPPGEPGEGQPPQQQGTPSAAAAAAAASASPCFDPPLRPCQRAVVRRALLRSRAEYTEGSAPCLLSPHRDNLHQIDAVDGPAAFLDILAPPYDPDDGRDCHYYRVLEPPAPTGPPNAGPAAPLPVPREVWLLETPQAADFWCESEPYPGPKVTP